MITPTPTPTVTPTPTPTSTPTEEPWNTYSSTFWDLTLYYPKDWDYEETSSGVTFQDEDYTKSGGNIGAALLVVGGPLDNPNMTVGTWWQEATNNITSGMPMVQISAPEPTTVGGEDALIGVLEASEQDIYGWLALVVHNGRGYIFLALVSPQDRWDENEDAFNLMLDSVEFLD